MTKTSVCSRGTGAHSPPRNASDERRLAARSRSAQRTVAPLLVTAFLINGAWGIGTALIVRLLSRPAALRQPARQTS
jgi:hypothetical protein